MSGSDPAGAAADPTAAVAVLHNGRCPVCRHEIEAHRRTAAREGLPLAFDDLHSPDRAGWSVDADAAARRLHARLADGRVVRGFEANLAMWRAVPRWRPLARVAGLPGLRPVLAWLYERAFAPLAYRMHLRREGGR
ncbi:thiol-disulfide oxidoreductase DCC family protein [Jannaschia sp. W003]|uniref:thiol-disulfide oxidoreductase DCC family protein n=1 Tax=Jannaschia sp. W003 TaxID=2867012 RepID=UPI0021A31418|nr:DUF393 domain-containing protein [Jannaschia sp. W003]UWQ22564.1 DUF393 domain-containing protein [Jannaschia sp. W003]